MWRYQTLRWFVSTALFRSSNANTVTKLDTLQTAASRDTRGIPTTNNTPIERTIMELRTTDDDGNNEHSSDDSNNNDAATNTSRSSQDSFFIGSIKTMNINQ